MIEKEPVIKAIIGSKKLSVNTDMVGNGVRMSGYNFKHGHYNMVKLPCKSHCSASL